MKRRTFVLYSGGAKGAEAEFGCQAEAFAVQEINYSFIDHVVERTRGLRVLTDDELALKDVSLTYVSRLMDRRYSKSKVFRRILQSICWQVASGREIFVVGTINPNGTVRGGTGWGAEYAKIRNKPLHCFDQAREGWFVWNGDEWQAEEPPLVDQPHFTGTGTRVLSPAGKQAIADLFHRSFAGPR